MPETAYTPVAEPPALEQLRADMKKAASEHPDYGSCPNCIKAVRVDRFGRLRDHNTPELARGALKATYRCPGSGKTYAEHGDFGETWDLRIGRWVELDVEVPVLFVAHDQAAAKGVELPLWQLCGVRALGVTRRGAKKLLDGSTWRIELVYVGSEVTGHLVRVDWDGGPKVWETQVDNSVFQGAVNVIEKLLSRLEESDTAETKAAHNA